MHTRQRTSLLVLAVLLAVTACVIPNVSFTDPAAQATILAVTVDAAIRATQKVQGAAAESTADDASAHATALSATPSLTPAPTETATETPTETPTVVPLVILSPTSILPMISVSVPTNCRSGPGKAYPMEGALLVDEVADVLGNDPTGNYWYIPNPDSPGDYCWVWGEYATISGYQGSVPLYTPPPTPLPTATPTASPGFDVSYVGLVECSGSWWTQMELGNSGALTFRSIDFSLRDLTLDTEDEDQADKFVEKPNCSSSTSKVSLAPGNSVVVSSPALSNDPSGDKMRAHITLCSKTGQSGECVTEVLNFKP